MNIESPPKSKATIGFANAMYSRSFTIVQESVKVFFRSGCTQMSTNEQDAGMPSQEGAVP